jgi:low temperature requirement A protein (LtrA)
MWWLYFSKEVHLASQGLAQSLAWGYGHVSIFASGAAVGAGFAVLVDIATGHAEAAPIVGDYAVAIPVASYLVGLWFVRDRFSFGGPARHVSRSRPCWWRSCRCNPRRSKGSPPCSRRACPSGRRWPAAKRTGPTRRQRMPEPRRPADSRQRL